MTSPQPYLYYPLAQVQHRAEGELAHLAESCLTPGERVAPGLPSMESRSRSSSDAPDEALADVKKATDLFHLHLMILLMQEQQNRSHPMDMKDGIQKMLTVGPRSSFFTQTTAIQSVLSSSRYEELYTSHKELYDFHRCMELFFEQSRQRSEAALRETQPYFSRKSVPTAQSQVLEPNAELERVDPEPIEPLPYIGQHSSCWGSSHKTHAQVSSRTAPWRMKQVDQPQSHEISIDISFVYGRCAVQIYMAGDPLAWQGENRCAQPYVHSGRRPHPCLKPGESRPSSYEHPFKRWRSRAWVRKLPRKSIGRGHRRHARWRSSMCLKMTLTMSICTLALALILHFTLHIATGIHIGWRLNKKQMSDTCPVHKQHPQAPDFIQRGPTSPTTSPGWFSSTAQSLLSHSITHARSMDVRACRDPCLQAKENVTALCLPQSWEHCAGQSTPESTTAGHAVLSDDLCQHQWQPPAHCKGELPQSGPKMHSPQSQVRASSSTCCQATMAHETLHLVGNIWNGEGREGFHVARRRGGSSHVTITSSFDCCKAYREAAGQCTHPTSPEQTR